MQGEPDVTERNTAYPVGFARSRSARGARLKNSNGALEGDRNGTKAETIGRKKNSFCSKTNRPPWHCVAFPFFRERSNED